jgi:hypothetical protein
VSVERREGLVVKINSQQKLCNTPARLYTYCPELIKEILLLLLLKYR